LDADDENHAAARAEWVKLLEARQGLLTNSYVLVDCVSFGVMRRLHLDHAFCFDAHFASQGLRVLPSGR
jgi:predicted nucleic acid-binding protein